MKPDILIKNGRIMDPARGVDAVEDVAIAGDRIVPIPANGEAGQVIDATDCLVFPGLIDFHAHLFHTGGVSPVKPDLLLATGVTAAVDAGTSGCANYQAFRQADIEPSHLLIKSFLHISSGGMPDEYMPEDITPAYFNESAIRRVVDRYRDDILGFKVRLARNLCSSIEPLTKTIAVAEAIGDGMRVCVHVTDAPCDMEKIADALRPGDVFCHMYHGRGHTILNADGSILPAIRRARERGVLFDSSHGKGNFSHQVAQRAVSEGFWPDFITTDIGDFKIYISHWARSLPFLMSKHLCMGMDFEAVLRAVTVTPARAMGLDGTIGTLTPGARADVALFTLEDRRVRYQDCFDTAYYGDKLLIPQFVICRGDYVWGAADFNIE